MRKTKIICTIGPACSDEATLRKMCLAGMNVARLNFSHGSHQEHLARIRMLQKVREELGVPLAIMLDTKGPEYRIGCFENGKIELKEGDLFTLTTRDVPGNQEMVSVSYKDLCAQLQPGDRVLINNGLLVLGVTTYWQNVAKGVVLVFALALDFYRTKRRNKVKETPHN